MMTFYLYGVAASVLAILCFVAFQAFCLNEIFYFDEWDSEDKLSILLVIALSWIGALACLCILSDPIHIIRIPPDEAEISLIQARVEAANLLAVQITAKQKKDA